MKHSRDWDILNRTDKVESVKNEVLDKMSKEYEGTSESLKELIGKIEGNQQSLEKKLEGFEKYISYTEKLSRMDSIFLEISSKIKDTQMIVQKGLDNFEPKKESPKLEIKQDPISNLPNPNHNIGEMSLFSGNDKPSRDKLSQFKYYNTEYEFLITLKQKSSELLIFDTKTKTFKQTKINSSNFIDATNSFNTYPDNSRYVNLGTSLLITGGYKDKQSTPYCYLMLFSKTNINDYEINIMSYPNMIEARERHNIIHLKDRESVLVCSGFFNQNCEITNMNTQTWRSLPKLNDIRANATLSYINRRFIYCFSGFKINDVKVGQYLSSVDILDLDNTSKGWTLFNFDSINVNLKLCAMGIINISESSLLVCGGYDGTQYKSDVIRIETKDEGSGIAKVEKIDSSLPGNYIFTHNAFMRNGNLSYNYDLQLNLISFDPMAPEHQFKVI